MMATRLKERERERFLIDSLWNENEETFENYELSKNAEKSPIDGMMDDIVKLLDQISEKVNNGITDLIQLKPMFEGLEKYFCGVPKAACKCRTKRKENALSLAVRSRLMLYVEKDWYYYFALRGNSFFLVQKAVRLCPKSKSVFVYNGKFSPILVQFVFYYQTHRSFFDTSFLRALGLSGFKVVL